MSWNDVRKLQKMGHIIGSHTKSHLRLSDIKSLPNLRNQIIAPINVFKKNKIKNLFFLHILLEIFQALIKNVLISPKVNINLFFLE